MGVSEAEPWVSGGSGEPAGVEADLVRAFASSVGLTPEWHWGSVEEHMARLEHFQLDVVAAGLTRKNPWTKQVGTTRPYFEDPISGRRHVLAVAPGENSLLSHLESSLEDGATRVARERLLEEAP